MKKSLPERVSDQQKRDRVLLKAAERAWTKSVRGKFEKILAAKGGTLGDAKRAGEKAWHEAPDKNREEVIDEARRKLS